MGEEAGVDDVEIAGGGFDAGGEGEGGSEGDGGAGPLLEAGEGDAELEMGGGRFVAEGDGLQGEVGRGFGVAAEVVKGGEAGEGIGGSGVEAEGGGVGGFGLGGEAFGEVDVAEEGVEGGGVFAEFGGLFEIGLGEGGLAAVAIDDAAEEVGPGVGFVALDERVEQRFGLFDAAEDDAALGEGALVTDVFGGFFGEGFEDGQGELGAAGAHVDAGELELFLFGGGLGVGGDHGEELGGEASGIGGEGGRAGDGGEGAAVEVVGGETEEMEDCRGDVGEAGVEEKLVGGSPGARRQRRPGRVTQA